MIQFNLLPAVKLEYLKAQRQRRIVVSVAIIVSIASVALLLLLLSADGLQKRHLSDISTDVSRESSELQHKPSINGILTVQNQLESLTALHQSKLAPTRIFQYLNQITPPAVNINVFNVDFTAYTMTISGGANSLSDVNQFVDTLKLTTYSTPKGSSAQPAFSDVVLTGFGVNHGQSGPAASYSVNLSYDKTIFDLTQQPTLTVPNQTSSNRSNDLFQGTPTKITTTGGGN